MKSALTTNIENAISKAKANMVNGRLTAEDERSLWKMKSEMQEVLKETQCVSSMLGDFLANYSNTDYS